jgi:hypothetical protein
MKKLTLIFFLLLTSCGYSYRYDKSNDSDTIAAKIEPLKMVSYENPKETINVEEFIKKKSDSLSKVKKEKTDSIFIQQIQLEKSIKKIKTQRQRIDSLIMKKR